MAVLRLADRSLATVFSLKDTFSIIEKYAGNEIREFLEDEINNTLESAESVLDYNTKLESRIEELEALIRDSHEMLFTLLQEENPDFKKVFGVLIDLNV